MTKESGKMSFGLSAVIADSIRNHLFALLDRIEREFDSDEWFEDPDKAMEYIQAAEFCSVHFSRKWNHNIKKWYDNHLPGWDKKEILPERY